MFPSTIDTYTQNIQPDFFSVRSLFLSHYVLCYAMQPTEVQVKVPTYHFFLLNFCRRLWYVYVLHHLFENSPQTSHTATHPRFLGCCAVHYVHTLTNHLLLMILFLEVLLLAFFCFLVTYEARAKPEQLYEITACKSEQYFLGGWIW